jgi:hypothetical protein
MNGGNKKGRAISNSLKVNRQSKPIRKYERRAHKEYIKYSMRTRFFQVTFRIKNLTVF